MSGKISIRLSSAKSRAQPLKEVELPVDFHEAADLRYTLERIEEGPGIKQWLMPGLCVIYEDLNACEGPAPELTVTGNHVSVVCYGGAPVQHVPEDSSHLSGIIEIRNAQVTSIPGGGAGGKRMLIVFSKPFLSGLLRGESWMKEHDLSDLPGPVSGNIYRYFLEFPVRQILNLMLGENLDASQRRHYFELKLKELFFMLHLQPLISGTESGIPAEIRQKLAAAKAYLLANYMAAPTIRQLSMIVSLNEFWLKQYFKIQFGTTIRSFVTMLRMEEAKLLLADNRSVSEVAARLGYKNVSHFILIFKRTFGGTPWQMMHRHDPGRKPADTRHDVTVSI